MDCEPALKQSHKRSLEYLIAEVANFPKGFQKKARNENRNNLVVPSKIYDPSGQATDKKNL